MSVLEEIAGIDPRIEARRREVAQAGYRRKRRWWLLLLALAVAAVAAWFWARATVLAEDPAPAPPVELAPVAAVAGPDGSPLGIDAEGRVLGPPPPDAVLPPVSGFGVVGQGSQLPDSFQDVLEVAVALSPPILERTAAVMPGADGGVVIAMVPSGEIVFGPPTEVDEKVRSLETVFDQVVDDCLVTVDVRVADQVAVRRNPAC